MVAGEFIVVLRKITFNMNNWKFFIPALLLLIACNNQQATKKQDDSTANKNLQISVDESFKPVMAEQIKVFEAAYPDTKVIAEYKSEADCIRDLAKDSTKIIIISRELS